MAFCLFPGAVVFSMAYSEGLTLPLVIGCLLAPLLAPSGLVAFAVYLWWRTGTPFASYEAQRYGWHQGDPVTLFTQPGTGRILDHPLSVLGYLDNPSLWNGLLGTVFLVVSLVMLFRVRHELTPEVRGVPGRGGGRVPVRHRDHPGRAHAALMLAAGAQHLRRLGQPGKRVISHCGVLFCGLVSRQQRTNPGSQGWRQRPAARRLPTWLGLIPVTGR